MFHACGLYVSRLRPLCSMLAASIYDTWLRLGEDCVLGRKEAIRGRLLYFVALRGGLANNGAGFVLLDSCFGGSCFSVVLFVVRAFGSFFWELVCVFCSML